MGRASLEDPPGSHKTILHAEVHVRLAKTLPPRRLLAFSKPDLIPMLARSLVSVEGNG